MESFYLLRTFFVGTRFIKRMNDSLRNSSTLSEKYPGGDSLLASDGGSDIFWVCKMLSSIPLGTRFGA